MIRRWTIIVGVSVCLVLVLVMIINSGGEPRFHGRALSTWIEDAENVPANSDHYYQSDERWRAATNAVSQIGTNALPTLLKWAFDEGPKPTPAIIEWLESHFHIRLHREQNVNSRENAAYGFEFLGNKAEPVWPMLVQRTYSKDAEQRKLALEWLNYTSHEHLIISHTRNTNSFLLPTALRLLNDADRDVQKEAAEILMEEYPQEVQKAGVYDLFPEMNPHAEKTPDMRMRE